MIKLRIISFLKEKKWFVKLITLFSCLAIVSAVQFFQRTSWLKLIGETVGTQQIVTHFLSFATLALLSPILLWFYNRVFHQKHKPHVVLFYSILGMMAFIGLHSLLISIFYYLAEPEWTKHLFILLFQDVLLNFSIMGGIFYCIALLFFELYDQMILRFGSENPDNILNIKEAGRLFRVQEKEIQYLVSADNYVKVCTQKRNILTRETMAVLERKLESGQFLRIHRSVIVNKSYVAEIQRTHTGELKVVMTDATILPMSRRRKEVKHLLINQTKPTIH